MSTDQDRPEQPEPDQTENVQDTVPLDLDRAPLDSQPTLELTGLATPEPYRTADPTTEFVMPAPAQSTPAQSTPAQSTPAQSEPVQSEPVQPPKPARPGPRVGTVVWGLILAVIGVGVIAAAAGAQFDVELVSIALLALAGVGLVVGSVATSVRRRRG